MLSLLIVSVVLVFALIGVVVWLASGTAVRRAVRERVLVTLKSGEGFDGVLLRVDRRSWELVDAKAIGDKGELVPVNGSLIVPAENVAFAQRP